MERSDITYASELTPPFFGGVYWKGGELICLTRVTR